MIPLKSLKQKKPLINKTAAMIKKFELKLLKKVK